MTAAAAQMALSPTDSELVGWVRAGEDAAFEELYRRYHRRIGAFVRRLVRDEARAEDVTQEAFLSALRRLRVTEAEIAFKPWIYEIARNAAIDLHRRSTRAEEVSMDQPELLRPSDKGRLVGASAPDVALFEKERLDHLRDALEELSDTHHRIIVMRELEGLSYREIGARLELSRPAVESALFRARRRLEHEYEELEAGRRCAAVTQAIARLAEGMESVSDRRGLERHARRCTSCRRRARQLGVEPLRRRQARRAAALVPLPAAGWLRGPSDTLGSMAAPGGMLSERVAALIAATALAGAGGIALQTSQVFDHPQQAVQPPQQRIVEPPRAAPPAPRPDVVRWHRVRSHQPTAAPSDVGRRAPAPAARSGVASPPAPTGRSPRRLRLPKASLTVPGASTLRSLSQLAQREDGALAAPTEAIQELPLEVPTVPSVDLNTVTGGVRSPAARAGRVARGLPAAPPERPEAPR